MTCFNPRTPCGVRHVIFQSSMGTKLFQSTHSLRSATRDFSAHGGDEAVSIHALLAECDRTRDKTPEPFSCFNPRTPCGVRQRNTKRKETIMKFQSTHSLRSATGYRGAGGAMDTVSIHALLAECDHQRGTTPETTKSFNPRTPCGVRLAIINGGNPGNEFQSTHSLRSATTDDAPTPAATAVSIHALLAECDGV